MTGTRHPTVGNVHIADTSGQNLVGTVVRGDVVNNMVTYVRGRPALYPGPTVIAERLACYVPADNHDLIVKTLYENRAVVLAGPAGCGRETTAIAAIREIHPGIQIRRFSVREEDLAEIRGKEPCGYLVNAADETPEGIINCFDAVRAASGYLVVIGEETDREGSGAFLPRITVDPPHPMRVYRKWLAGRGLGDTEWPYWAEAPVLLRDALPADAHRLAGLVEEVERKGGDTAARRTEVAHAYRGWATKLCDWFTAHHDPRDRTLLVAAATLAQDERTPVSQTSVYSVAAVLARGLDIGGAGAGLGWCPVTELSTLVEAECTDERIVFRQHGFARAVLRHVWRDYPLTRPDLLTWLAALPTDEAVPPARRDSLVQTFTELAAEYGEAGRITKAARGWAEADLPDLACITLSQSCLDRQVGGRVREKLYHWSRQARTPQTLKLTIARVCEPLGQTYPSIALTRLKHLATYGNRQVLEQVMEAAAGLVKTGRRREVFAAALAWCTDNPFENLSAAARERRIRAGARLFVTVAGRPAPSGVPAMLDGEGAVDPMDCVLTWCAALRTYATVPEQPDPVLGETLRHWLNAALHHPHLRDGITRCLVRAARTTAPPSPGNRTWPPRPNPTAARTVRALVRQWAALDIADQARRSVKEGVVVPLTDPWWWRLCKIAYVWLRTFLAQRREPG